MSLRLALRRLAATPAFTAGAIAVLALGTGATLAVFTVLNALVLNTLPVPDPSRLVAIEIQNGRGEVSTLSRPLFDALLVRQRTLSNVAGVLGGSVVSAETGGTVHQAVVDGVVGDYFRLLGIPVVAGRPLDADDARATVADADPVAVISEGYASRVLGGTVQALHRPIVLGEATVIVVGVMADTFPGIQVGTRTDIVVPAPVVGRIIGLQPNAVPLRYAFGRLTDGGTLDEVRAEWSTIFQSERASIIPGGLDAAAQERRLAVTSGGTGVSHWRARYEHPLQLIVMASTWLMVIACINLAGLQLARGLRRQHEFAVVRALGARGWDVIAPTAAEALMVSLAGLLLGVPLAAWGARIAVELLGTGFVPLTLDLRPNWRTWTALSAGAALVTTIAGVLPAWLATREAVGPEATTRVVPGSGRASAVLLVGQMALAVVLLSGAGLAVHALLRVAWRDHGFISDRVVAAQLMNRPGGYTNLDDSVYYRALLDRVVSLPGVSAAALAKPVPGSLSSPATLEPVSRAGQTPTLEASVVMASPGYFNTLGLAVLSGRAFDWRDNEGAPPVAVISRSLARDLIPGGIGTGLRIDVGRLPHHRGLEVIGIADDASVVNVRDAAPRVVYVSTLQQPAPFARWPGLIVRHHADAPAPPLDRAIDDVGREFVSRIETLPAIITRALARERLLAGAAVVYGVLATLLVAIGLWALLAQDVARRRREFGVRLSVGASPGSLYRAVTARGLTIAVAGTGIGVAVSGMVAQVLHATVGTDSAATPLILTGVGTLMFVLTVCAAAGPARRAARTEPMAALRSE
jgi:predicted permease